MKTYKNFLFIALAMMFLSSCGGGRVDNDSSYNRNYSDEEYASSDRDYTSEIQGPSEDEQLQTKLAEIQQMPELKNYKGLYKFTDENGTSFDVYFTNEGSVIITTSNADVYYCQFSDYTNIDDGIWVKPSEGEINISFKGGEEKIKNYNTLVIKDNWIYASTSYADSNNPNWRLPIKAVKAYPSKKARQSSNDSSSSSSTSSNATSKQPSEEEIRAMETMMYGYNEAAWRAKKRAEQNSN